MEVNRRLAPRLRLPRLSREMGVFDSGSCLYLRDGSILSVRDEWGCLEVCNKGLTVERFRHEAQAYDADDGGSIILSCERALYKNVI